MIKTALQTISWGDPQHCLFNQIFAEAHKARFDGLEIGFRRLGQITTDEARTLLNKYELELSASHVGGNLADFAQAADERAGLDKVIDYLIELRVPYLIYSGLNRKDDEGLDAEIVQIGEYSDRCADQGITMLYHNHNWEFRDNCRIWRRLQDAKIGSLGFAPDLGWAVMGGYQMGRLLDDIGASIKVLHFKDFAIWGDGRSTCHLGTGVIDFAPVWAWLKGQTDRTIWLTAEQDYADDNDAACASNGAYLATKIAEIGQ